MKLYPNVRTWWVRKLVYRVGLRPRPGSVFYSPSLDLVVQFSRRG